jgi:hypothetical protein
VMTGLYLPRATLEDIYFRTASRIFPALSAPPYQRETRADSRRTAS